MSAFESIYPGPKPTNLEVVLLAGNKVGSDLGALDTRLDGVLARVGEEVPGRTGSTGSTETKEEGGVRGLAFGRGRRRRVLATGVSRRAEGGGGGLGDGASGASKRGGGTQRAAEDVHGDEERGGGRRGRRYKGPSTIPALTSSLRNLVPRSSQSRIPILSRRPGWHALPTSIIMFCVGCG